MKYCFIILLGLLSFNTVDAQKNKQTLKDSLAVFDAYVQKAMKDWNVPGIAIAIVKNDEIVFTKGYGVREYGTDKKVDSKTYFNCASTTKAMTATCMAMLVDEGKLDWDDPVIKYLPDFQLYDPYVTRELTVRDLFLHNSGVGNTDYLWGDNILTADQVLAKMKLVKPSYSFRSSFIYQNIFYLAAGKVIEKVSGKPWDVFIKERIFDPLGMTNTKALNKEVTGENRTMPHFIVNGQVVAIDRTTADEIAPAGSVNSCADDMAKWIKCMIDSSKYSSGRLVKPETWMYLLKPKTLVTESQFYPTQYLTKPNFTTYAMGWFQQDYKGDKLNFHTGSLDGLTAINAQLPDKKFGIYIFGNLDHAEVRHALMFKAIDYFALGGDRDWSTDMKALYDSINAEAKKADSLSVPVQVMGTKPSVALPEYAGDYVDELYGSVKIVDDNDQLKVIINTVLHGVLAHYHYNTFKVTYEKKHYPNDYYTFNLNNNGKVESITISGITYMKN